MQTIPPSIFNDVIGPVMRGPSSSHTAAAVRIGRIIRQFCGGTPEQVKVEFAPEGSLATTYSSQGSDFGLAGGLLGMNPQDDRLTDAISFAAAEKMALTFQISDFPADHPNTYKIEAKGKNKKFRFIFLSTGGGMLVLTSINDLPVDIRGDYYELLYFVQSENEEQLTTKVEQLAIKHKKIDQYSYVATDKMGLLNIKLTEIPEPELLAKLQKQLAIIEPVQLNPVLPVLSRKNITLPFETVQQLQEKARIEQKDLWELAVDYESARGNISKEMVLQMASDLLMVMQNSCDQGIKGTDYDNRILGPQAALMLNSGQPLFGGVLVRDLIAFITAIMETKSAMGLIVAAPTAGSCGALPGTLIAAASEQKSDHGRLVKSLLAAAVTGIFIARDSTFAAEEGGCQAECGSASAMAAAGLVQLAGGNVNTALTAASLALQNVIGLVCDPVANRVEVPCLGKNVLAGMNALAAANMALAGFDQVIPFNQVIGAFDQAGRMLPSALRCTGNAGLSITSASLSLQQKLNGKTLNSEK